jgi:hypothetical protein
MPPSGFSNCLRLARPLTSKMTKTVVIIMKISMKKPMGRTVYRVLGLTCVISA